MYKCIKFCRTIFWSILTPPFCSYHPEANNSLILLFFLHQRHPQLSLGFSLGLKKVFPPVRGKSHFCNFLEENVAAVFFRGPGMLSERKREPDVIVFLWQIFLGLRQYGNASVMLIWESLLWIINLFWKIHLALSPHKLWKKSVGTLR